MIECNSILGDKIDANLDSFGLVDTEGLGLGKSSISEASKAISISKSIIFKLSKFTNVYDTTLLEIEQAYQRHVDDIFSDWIITFKNQKYKSLEVINTRIMVVLCDNMQYVMGHHYKDIYIPEKDIVDIDSAKNSLIGYKLNYECNHTQTLEITDSVLVSNHVDKVIYPLKMSNCIEFRVAWQVPIGECEECAGWYIYVDVIFGNILYIYQTFIC